MSHLASERSFPVGLNPGGFANLGKADFCLRGEQKGSELLAGSAGFAAFPC